MTRKTHTIDVTKKSLGRVATEIALLLMGKDEESYRPHEDKGGFVVVKNIDKIVVTGKKEEDKIYYRHSGYPGGLKETSYTKLLEKDHTAALKKAVYGMLPKNKLRKERIKRLKVE
jgi:large subunit ribosomal protein L13